MKIELKRNEMNTDHKQIIAAAKKAGFFISNKQIFTAVLEHLPLTKNLERFYAIAAASRDAEIAELVATLEKAAEEIRRCDYTPARSTLLVALAKVRKP